MAVKYSLLSDGATASAQRGYRSPAWPSAKALRHAQAVRQAHDARALRQTQGERDWFVMNEVTVNSRK